VDLQVWVYHHILDDRKLTQHAWGCYSPSTPDWQRYTVMALYPVLRLFLRQAFGIDRKHYAKAVEHIESLLAEVEELLSDGRVSILGGETINYVDITFASFSALWLQPPGYGGGKADKVRIEREDAPRAMQADIERWIVSYPRVIEFIERLYQQERKHSTRT